MINPTTTPITLPYLTTKGTQTLALLEWSKGDEAWYPTTRSQPLKQTCLTASPLSSVQPIFIRCQVQYWLWGYKTQYLLSWKASFIYLANGWSTYHVPGTMQWLLRDYGLTGPTDIEYTNISEINVPNVDFQDVRAAYSKGSQTSQHGSRKAFLFEQGLEGCKGVSWMELEGAEEGSGKGMCKGPKTRENLRQRTELPVTWFGWRVGGRRKSCQQ